MKTVLIVEDSYTQREIISKLLKESGLNVKEASDGREALKQVQEHCPDLVLLDIIMPGMNGYEVCRRIKSESIDQKPAVVICSIKKEKFDQYWGMKQGADAYIAKPCYPQELVGTVKQVLLKQVKST